MIDLVEQREQLLISTKKHQEAVSKIITILNGFSKRESVEVFNSVKDLLDSMPITTVLQC